MNRVLVTQYLYDLFLFAKNYRIHPKDMLNDLFMNEQFIQMMKCKPHDILEIKRLIFKEKKSKNLPSNEALRYLSFLIAAFLETTNVDYKFITRYIDAVDIIDNYIQYHIKDTNEVIFDLMIRYNEKYKSRKMVFDYEDALTAMKYNLLRLFPLKRFEQFEQIIDWRIDNIVFYTKQGEILIWSDNLDELFEDDYFKNKYLIGNKVYCFSNKDNCPKTPPTSLYFFYIKKEEIIFIEPGDKKHSFKISN